MPAGCSCICMDEPRDGEAVLTHCGHGPMCRPCITAHLQNQVLLPACAFPALAYSQQPRVAPVRQAVDYTHVPCATAKT